MHYFFNNRFEHFSGGSIDLYFKCTWAVSRPTWWKPTPLCLCHSTNLVICVTNVTKITTWLKCTKFNFGWALPLTQLGEPVPLPGFRGDVRGAIPVWASATLFQTYLRPWVRVSSIHKNNSICMWQTDRWTELPYRKHYYYVMRHAVNTAACCVYPFQHNSSVWQTNRTVIEHMALCIV